MIDFSVLDESKVLDTEKQQGRGGRLFRKGRFLFPLARLHPVTNTKSLICLYQVLLMFFKHSNFLFYRLESSFCKKKVNL